MDTEKQRQRRRDNARLTESGNARSEQLLVIPMESISKIELLPGELLSGPECQSSGWFLDINYQTCSVTSWFYCMQACSTALSQEQDNPRLEGDMASLLKYASKFGDISLRFTVEIITIQSTYNVALDSLHGQSNKTGTRQVAWHLEWSLQLPLRCSRTMNQKPPLQVLRSCVTLLCPPR